MESESRRLLYNWVTLGESLDFSKPQLSPLWNGDDNGNRSSW